MNFDFAESKVAQRRIRRAAGTFAENAFLHARARDELLARLEPVKLNPARILDLGGGCGLGALALARRYRKADVILVDNSTAMVAQAERRRGWLRRYRCLQADAMGLPLADGSVDLVFANLLLPYLQDPDRLFQEVRRVLKPRGYFAFSTLGAGTLEALQAAFEVADSVPHVADFEDLHDVGDRLSRAGYVAPVLDADRITITYETLADLCRDLRSSAAGLAKSGRTTLTGVRRWRAAAAAFEAQREADGRTAVGCELVYGQAWAPDPDGAQVRRAPREVVVPLTHLGKR
jgi:malonyl-CoA O-methyltransferase